MKIIALRLQIDKGFLACACLFALMPIYGLITGTAFPQGRSTIEPSLLINPDRYWFIIKLECYIVGVMLIRSIVVFPLIYAVYQTILRYRDEHKVIAYLLLYLITPIVVVIFLLSLLYYFDL